MNWIPIDAGFGYWKAIVNGKEIKFSNHTGNYHFSQNGLIGSDDTPLSISIDNLGAWNFGKTALLQSTSPSRKQSSDRIFSNEYLAGLLLAISEGYSKNTDTIECAIITGLPGSDFNRLANNPALKNDFRRFIIGDYRIQRPSYRQHIIIKDMRYTQQAWGAIWKQLIDSNGNILKLNVGRASELSIGCINVGYNTLEGGEVLVSRLGQGMPKIDMVEGRQLSVTHGVHTITDRLIADLTNQFSQNFDKEKAIDVLENGGLILDGKWQEYHLSENIRSELSETVYDSMTNIWQSGTSFLYRLILTGGGANIVSGRFANMPQVVVSSRPQFDTVEGYLRLAKNVFRGK